MGSIPWILVSLLILIIVLAVVAFIAYKQGWGKHKPDYYGIFIMGVIFFVFGLIANYSVFWILGLVYMILGLNHKNEWKKNRKTLKNMGKKERKLLIVSIVILLVLFLSGIVVYLFVTSQGKVIEGNINNFEECAAKYPVGESYPRQCWTPGGKHFVEDISEWQTDGVILMQNSETQEFACFGCNTPSEGPALCIDSALIMKEVGETSAKHCNENFEIVGDEKTFCSDASRGADACIASYEPVCGWHNPEKIQCIRFPCADDYTNSCNACLNPDVLYWTDEVCPE